MTASAPAPGKKAVFTQTEAQNTGSFAPVDWVLFSAISLIWGASFFFIEIGLEAVAPGVITLARVGLGAVTLTVLNLAQGRSLALPQPEDRRLVALLGIVWVAIPFTLFPLAQEHINSAVTGLLNGGTPIFVAVVAAALLRQPSRGPQLVGIVVGFVGIVLMSAPSLGNGSSEARGVLMVLAATVCYGFAMNMAAPLQAKYGSIQLLSWVLAVAAVLTIPFGIYDLRNSSAALWPLLAVAILGIVGTGVAYGIMGELVGRVGAPRASFITYVIPGVALILGVSFRDNEVSALALAGVVLVLAGAFLASRKAS